MKEKRKFVRFEVAIPFELFCGKSEAGAKGLVKDISMSGLKVCLDKKTKVTMEAVVHFNIFLSERPLKTSARIVWEKDDPDDKKEIGMRFTQMLDNHKEEILNFIFKHYQKEAIQKWWQP